MTGWGLFASWDGHRLRHPSSWSGQQLPLWAVNWRLSILSFRLAFMESALTTVTSLSCNGGLTAAVQPGSIDKDKTFSFEAKLDWRGWLKYLALTALIWLVWAAQ